MTTRSTRAVKKIEKPKPLKFIASNRHSSSDIPSVTNEDEVLKHLEAIASALRTKSATDNINYFIAAWFNTIIHHGQRLEDGYKDKLDKAFSDFRNGSKDDSLDHNTRLNLLQLVEARATQWSPSNSTNAYYTNRNCMSEVGDIIDTPPPVNNVLAPGEILKSSGKYNTPTRVPGKNYYRDEVVIRNADSGKVSPGAKERNVQITGPEEEKIVLAKQLIEDTIRRNASPIREVEKEIGSNSSLNSSASDDSTPAGVNSSIGKLMKQNKENDTFEYKHTVIVKGDSIKLKCNNYDLLKQSKLILESAFNGTKTMQMPEPGVFNNNNNNNSKSTLLTRSISTSTVSFEKEEVAMECKKEPISKKAEERNFQECKKAEVTEKKPLQPINTSVGPEKEQTSAAMEGKKEPISKVEVTEKKQPACVKCTQYTKDFLLELSSCKTARKPPPNWDRISQAYPNIIKQETSYFDAILYTKKWIENEGKPAPIIDANLEYVDSE